MRNSRPECIEALETFWEKRMSGEEKEKWLSLLEKAGIGWGEDYESESPNWVFYPEWLREPARRNVWLGNLVGYYDPPWKC